MEDEDEEEKKKGDARIVIVTNYIHLIILHVAIVTRMFINVTVYFVGLVHSLNVATMLC